MMHWGYGFGNWGWAGMLLGGVMLLLFVGGLIVLILLAVRTFTQPSLGQNERGGSSPSSTSSNRSLEIIKERYARGELTKTQYDKMRHDLLE